MTIIRIAGLTEFLAVFRAFAAAEFVDGSLALTPIVDVPAADATLP